MTLQRFAGEGARAPGNKKLLQIWFRGTEKSNYNCQLNVTIGLFELYISLEKVKIAVIVGLRINHSKTGI